MSLDLTDLVPIYQEAIDDIINSMGKNVMLIYPSQLNISSNIYDNVNEDSKLPEFKFGLTVETSVIGLDGLTLEQLSSLTLEELTVLELDSVEGSPSIEYETEVIKALIKYSPSDFVTFGTKAQLPDGVVRLKTFLSDVPKLKRCEYIMPNYDSRDIIYTRYRMIREPIPVGLQKDRYAISYWERF